MFWSARVKVTALPPSSPVASAHYSKQTRRTQSQIGNMWGRREGRLIRVR